MFHLLLKTPSSLLLLFLHDNRVKSSKWNFWDYISLFTFKEESVDRWSPGNVHFPFLCLSCWRFVLPLMIFPETLCNSCWVIIGDKNALFPLSPSQPFFLHLFFIFHPEVVLLKRKSIETVADTDVEERSSFTRFPKYSQVFPNIRKYISISHFFIHRKILHGWSSLWDNRTGKRLQRRPERETRQSFVLTLLVEPLPKTIILPPARDYSSHLGLRNKTTWGVHRSRGPPQVIVV